MFCSNAGRGDLEQTVWAIVACDLLAHTPGAPQLVAFLTKVEVAERMELGGGVWAEGMRQTVWSAGAMVRDGRHKHNQQPSR